MLKEIFKYLGYTEEELKDFDTFKSKFDKDFIRPTAFKESDAYKEMVGATLGSATGKIKNALKDFEITLSAEEIKDKNYHEVLAIGMGKLKEANKAKIAELEGKQGQGVEEAKKEWEGKYTKLKQSFDEQKGLLDSTSGDFEKYKGETANKFKGFKIDTYKKSVFEKFPLISTASQFEKAGFLNHLNENYLVDFDEDGETPILKTIKGERIKSDVTSGKLKGFEEVFQEEAKKANLLQLTKSQATGTTTTFNQPANNGGAQPAAKEVFIHPNARV